MRINQQRTILALGIAIAIGFAAQAQNQQEASSTSWRDRVDQMIDEGQFAQASKLMSKLPRKVRQQQAFSIDSLNEIMRRIRKDFNLTPEEGLSKIREKYPQATEQNVAEWKRSRALEVMNIDGQEWWFRKSVRNLWLLAPEFQSEQAADKEATVSSYRNFYRQAMQSDPDAMGVRYWHRANVTFTLDVKADAVPAGKTIRCWMPFPFENMRQKNIKLLGSNRPVTMSEGSKHHTVYMEAEAVKGQSTHFEYTFTFDVAERHMCRQDLQAMVLPYDPNSEAVRCYTGTELPQIVITDSMRQLASDIAGIDANPVVAAARIYHWVGERFPWAGAREYSTMRNIPEYVLLNRHGDCGMAALLYITLVRSLGIPARWESGWMLHPGEENYHDWAETYFEGVGWVPTDASFGRSVVNTDLEGYYATGIDCFRMATNEGIADKLSPAKKFLRSETLDFQAGEVEWDGGNIYYDSFSSHLNVNSFTPIK